ncbi:MAG: hypothetical protein IJ852_04720 [Alphaproteobacteria bacterium]|nr:hypothetical protein [Alphaproteobacteria bacterium]
MKNKILYILLSLVFTTMLFWPQMTYADEESSCDQKVEENLDKNIQAALPVVAGLLKSYNKAAENYRSQCNSALDLGIPTTYTTEQKAAAQMANNNQAHELLTNDDLYKFTGVVWSNEQANNESCQARQNLAWSAKKQYTAASARLGYMLDIKGGRDLSVPKKCVCSEHSDDAECYAQTDTEDEPKKSDDDCPLFSEYMNKLIACPFCRIVKVILVTDVSIANIAWKNIAQPISGAVIAIFFALLALETLKTVSNIAGSGIGSYLKNILVLGFKVAITVLILNDQKFIYDYFIMPVIKGGLDMGLAILTAANNTCPFNDPVDIDGGVFGKEFIGKVYNAVKCFNHVALIMPAIGRGLICHGWANDGSLLPDVSMWLAGIINYGFGLIIWIALIFYFIDCTIQLGFVSALLPLFIACWPFKATQRYSFTGVKMLMNVFFSFVMIGILMTIGLEIVSFATTGGTTNSQTLIKLLNSSDDDNIKLLKNLTDLDTEAVLILIACCVYAIKLISKTNAIASTFSSGGGSNFGSKLGGIAASATVSAGMAQAKSVGKGTLQGASSFASTVAHSSAGQAVGNAAKSAGRAAKGYVRRQYDKRTPELIKKTVSATGRAAKATADFVSTADVRAASWIGRRVGLGQFQNQNQGSGLETPENQTPPNDQNPRDES